MSTQNPAHIAPRSIVISYEQLLRLLMACDASPVKLTLDPEGKGAIATFPSIPRNGSIHVGASASQNLRGSSVEYLELQALDVVGRAAIVRFMKPGSVDVDLSHPQDSPKI